MHVWDIEFVLGERENVLMIPLLLELFSVILVLSSESFKAVVQLGISNGWRFYWIESSFLPPLYKGHRTCQGTGEKSSHCTKQPSLDSHFCCGGEGYPCWHQSGMQPAESVWTGELFLFFVVEYREMYSSFYLLYLNTEKCTALSDLTADYSTGGFIFKIVKFK